MDTPIQDTATERQFGAMAASTVAQMCAAETSGVPSRMGGS